MIRLLRHPVPETRPNPCGTAAILNPRSRSDMAVFPIGFPPTLGKTSGLPPPSARASSRVSNARRGQRDPVLSISLRASGGYGPHPLVPVDLRPRGPTNLAGACRRQNQELEQQLHHRPCVRRPHRPERGCHFPVGQRPHVTYGLPLRAEHRTDPVARVVGTKIHCHGPLQDRADALAQLRAVGAFSCQIGARIPITSALVTSAIGIFPI